jgi:pimeloyl-ACP methyl ester carboxylesterase
MPYYTMRDGEQIFAYVMGEGSPCVVVSGLGGRARMWVPLIVTLSDPRCQFILMDPRGSGESAIARQTKPHFEQFAEDVDDLLDSLGHAKAKLIGCSQGAYACLVKYKVTGFSRISSFLLYEHAIKVAPAEDYQYGINAEVFGLYRAVVATWKRLELDVTRVPFEQLPREFQRAYKAMYIETGKYCFHSFWTREVAQLLFRATFRSIQLPTNAWHGVMRMMEDYIHHDYGISLKDLEQMRLPVTVMYGRRSRLFPSDAILEMARHMPNAEVIAFESSGHAFIATEPQKFRAELARFLMGPLPMAPPQSIAA